MCMNKIILTITWTLFPLKSKVPVYSLCLQDCLISFNVILINDLTHIRCETLPCCFGKESQPIKQMSEWEQHILYDNSYTYMKQSACVLCLLKKRQLNIKTSTHQGVDKNCKNESRKEIIIKSTHHAFFALLYWWNKPSSKSLQTNDTSIWIVSNVFSVAIHF